MGEGGERRGRRGEGECVTYGRSSRRAASCLGSRRSYPLSFVYLQVRYVCGEESVWSLWRRWGRGKEGERGDGYLAVLLEEVGE